MKVSVFGAGQAGAAREGRGAGNGLCGGSERMQAVPAAIHATASQQIHERRSMAARIRKNRPKCEQYSARFRRMPAHAFHSASGSFPPGSPDGMQFRGKERGKGN